MNAHATAEAVEEAGAGLVILETNPVALLTDEARFEQFFAQVKAEASKVDVDLTTEKGRKAIGSMAYKIAQAKNRLDAEGKKLTEEAREQIKKVNDARGRIWDRLEALQAEVRRPLTEWEEAEAKRKAQVEDILGALSDQAVVTIDDNSTTVRARLLAVQTLPLDEAILSDSFAMAEAMQANAVNVLTTALARLEREEADRAELEQLRAQKAEQERIEKERAEQEAAEAKRKADEEEAARRQKEAAEAEEKRVAEAAEAARLETQRKADEAAAAELKRIQDEADAAVRKAEAEAQALRDQQAAEQRQRDEAAAEARRREQDREHRGRIMGEAKAALMETCDLTEEAARRIVLAICAGSIPHTAVNF